MLNKEKVTEHYDLLSPYYYQLWGNHIHHGFWKTGKETKEQAQEQLIEELATKGGLKAGMKVLDVGCGVGGTAIYLSKKYQAQVLGITISPVQVYMAKKLAEREKVSPKFLLADAEKVNVAEKFDIVWSIEAVSHFDQPEKFFTLAEHSLTKGGKLVVADWFKAEGLTPEQEQAYIEPIKYGMMVPKLGTIADYTRFAQGHSFKVLLAEDLSKHVLKTWQVTYELIKSVDLWKAALWGNVNVLVFMKTFRYMQRGYSSKTFRYGVLVAERQ